ncbi:hypothetical protein ALC53_06861 [Atta colombica]|uniref:Uncharacterized protein n=1 Tax=Atta colombica TaxID=520822 RepID=A0A195BDP3_9HYME|nr:hypothetical protein ALC53_06861 [Atta colombica]
MEFAIVQIASVDMPGSLYYKFGDAQQKRPDKNLLTERKKKKGRALPTCSSSSSSPLPSRDILKTSREFSDHPKDIPRISRIKYTMRR